MRIKKMRENAILPKSVNGNFMDVYASAIACVSWEDFHNNGFNQTYVTEGAVNIYRGNVVIVKLGFALEMPEGHIGYLLPRSSTFKTYGLLLSNSMGVIDNNYCGDNDEWTMVFYATQNSVMRIGDRPGQMQLFYDVCIHQFEEVEHLGNEDRGGYGSTGK